MVTHILHNVDCEYSNLSENSEAFNIKEYLLKAD